MSNHQEIIDLAKVVTGNEHLYSLQPFIKITGDPLLGLFLERVVYWSDKSSNSNLKQLKIFYKTAEEWEEELGLSYAQVTRARKTLESMGFIQTSKHKVAGAPTLHYYANVGAIKEAINLFYQSSSVDYANLNNSEIQGSPNSEDDSFQFEETVETIEIQESEHSSYNSSNSSNNSTKDSSPNGEVPPPLPKEEVIKVEYTPFLRDFLARFSAKRFRNPTQFKTVSDLVDQHGEAELESLAEWAANKGMGLGQAIPAIKSALKNPKRTKHVTAEAAWESPPDPIPKPPKPEHVTVWEAVKPMVRDQMTRQTFDTLFKDARPVARENGTFELRVKASALEMIAARPKVKANVLTAIQAVKPEIHDLDFKELTI